MTATDTHPSHPHLLQGCLDLDSSAWSCFYARFGELIDRTVRRALGARVVDANLVDELVEEVNVNLFLGRIALSAFEERADLLEKFLEQSARQVVRRYFQKRTRRRKHEVQATNAQLAKLTREFELVDDVTVEEFRARLTPAQDHFFVTVLLGNREKPPGHPAATDGERRLTCQISESWKNFRAER